MAIHAAATATRGAIIGDVVDMPTSTVYIVRTAHGMFYVHDDEIIAQQHDNGVHINCNGECPRFGTVDRFHSHDYDGLIICCDDE